MCGCHTSRLRRTRRASSTRVRYNGHLQPGPSARRLPYLLPTVFVGEWPYHRSSQWLSPTLHPARATSGDPTPGMWRRELTHPRQRLRGLARDDQAHPPRVSVVRAITSPSPNSQEEAATRGRIAHRRGGCWYVSLSVTTWHDHTLHLPFQHVNVAAMNRWAHGLSAYRRS
jgi:hypothetical protein